MVVVFWLSVAAVAYVYVGYPALLGLWAGWRPRPIAIPAADRSNAAATGVSRPAALQYLSGLDYGLRYEHLAGLTTFFGKLAASGRVPNGSLVFLPAA